MSTQVLPALITIDLDGTLIDSAPDIAWALDRAMEAMDRPTPGLAKARNWVGNGVAVLVQRALTDSDGAEPDEALHTEALGHFDRAYVDHYAVDSVPYPGVLETLDWLAARGVPLACVTNKPMKFTVPMLVHYGMGGRFGQILGGDSLPTRKPDPAPLQHCAAGVGAVPADCLHIGDSRTDVQAARNAGFKALAVSFGYNHGEPIADSAPDVVVDNWREIPAQLN